MIDRFFYVSDRGIERGAHLVHSSGEYVPLSSGEFGVELKYAVNGDTARVTRKYAILSGLLKNNIGSSFADTENIGGSGGGRSIMKNDRLDMPRIRMSHVMTYDRLVRNLFGELTVKNEDDDLSIEKLNANYKHESSNKGYVLYRHKVR